MAELCDAARSVLILVDFQEALLPAIHEGEAALERAIVLARAARELGVPVVGTEQNPDGLGPNHPRIRQLCDRTIAKTHFAATSQPDFLTCLDPQRDELIVAGCEAHVCVLQTTIGLLDIGYQCFVAGDATSSRSAANAPALKALPAARCTFPASSLDKGSTIASTALTSASFLGFSTLLGRDQVRLIKDLGLGFGKRSPKHLSKSLASSCFERKASRNRQMNSVASASPVSNDTLQGPFCSSGPPLHAPPLLCANVSTSAAETNPSPSLSKASAHFASSGRPRRQPNSRP